MAQQPQPRFFARLRFAADETGDPGIAPGRRQIVEVRQPVAAQPQPRGLQNRNVEPSCQCRSATSLSCAARNSLSARQVGQASELASFSPMTCSAWMSSTMLAIFQFGSNSSEG